MLRTHTRRSSKHRSNKTTRDDLTAHHKTSKHDSRSRSTGIANFASRSFRCGDTPKPVKFLLSSKRKKLCEKPDPSIFHSHTLCLPHEGISREDLCLHSHGPFRNSMPIQIPNPLLKVVRCQLVCAIPEHTHLPAA
jgi:hypothetical protein